jgi:hypothetical protein
LITGVARAVVELAQHVVDGGGASLVVEIRITDGGPERPLLLLDTNDTNKQFIVWPPAPWTQFDEAADLQMWRKLGLPMQPPE